MNCPLCDTPLDENGICPNCGTAAQPEAAACEDYQTTARAEKYADLPGIYLSSLAEDEDEDEVVSRSGRKKRTGLLARLRSRWQAADEKSRWNIRFSAGMVGGTLLLFLVLTLFYAPNAPAVSGKNGISLTNREFYLYYCSAYSSYVSSSTDSSGNVSLPFTTDRSLDRQYYDLESGYSWQDYFMDQALYSAALTESLVAAAEDAGMALTEDEETAIQSQLDAMAEAGDGDPDAYLQAYYGGPVSAAVYQTYLRHSTLAQDYYEYLYNSAEFTDEELLTYYQSHTDDYSTLTVTDQPNVVIRHILFVPTGDTQEAWDTAEAQAQAALQQCEAAEDPEAMFLSLVPELSQDSGTNQSGGELEVYPGAIGGGFDEWCFDEAGHSAGELGVAMSSYGWHLLWFEDYSDTTYWKQVVQGDMQAAAAAEQVAALYSAADCQLSVFADVP